MDTNISNGVNGIYTDHVGKSTEVNVIVDDGHLSSVIKPCKFMFHYEYN